MASAQAHPVSDPAGKRIPDFNDSYDDKVGVGAPNGYRANQIMTDETSSFDKAFTPTKLGPVVSIYTPANHRLRVVLVWDQCPGYSPFNPELNVDFDMVIAGPPPPSLGLRREYISTCQKSITTK